MEVGKTSLKILSSFAIQKYVFEAYI